MISPLYTRSALILSCALFSYSFFSVTKRFQTARVLSQSVSIQTLSHANKSTLPIFTFSTKYEKSTVAAAANEHKNQKYLREKVLNNTNETHQSILHRFVFFNPPKPVCSYPQDTEHSMIIIVLSRGLNFDYRQAIRDTWGRNGKYKQTGISIRTIFFVGTDDTVQTAVKDEQEIFNDVVEIAIPENYPFVAHKELASLLWTRLYCPLARFVFRADDDILLDIFLLLNYVQKSINLDTNDGLYGWFRSNNSVHRADRWSVTKLEYSPKIYPPYTFGIGYLFSNVSCQRLIDTANHPNHQVIRIGDAYITGILRDAAGIPFYDFANLTYAYTFFNEIPCDKYFEERPQLLMCMAKLHVGIRGDFQEFYDTWEIILAKYNTSTFDL